MSDRQPKLSCCISIVHWLNLPHYAGLSKAGLAKGLQLRLSYKIRENADVKSLQATDDWSRFGIYATWQPPQRLAQPVTAHKSLPICFSSLAKQGTPHSKHSISPARMLDVVKLAKLHALSCIFACRGKMGVSQTP